MARLEAWLSARVSGASLAALRILFGTLMLAATLRFAAMGWIDTLLLAPRFHFTYWGFGWVHPWPPPLMHVHFVLLGLAALLVLLGLFYRVAIVSFAMLFLYVELIDVTTYLNHYYAITLMALLLSFLPAANTLSLDAWRAKRRGTPMDASVPRAAVVVLQAQLAIIYFFAGVAKLGADWLLRAEPLTTWLLTRTELPVIGPRLAHPAVPFVMSWAGMLFDLTIPLWLCLNRTRKVAYLAVVVFHALTAWLFPIGMFPWVMIGLTPIFFGPDWPLQLARSMGRKVEIPAPSLVATSSSSHARRWGIAMAAWLAVQCIVPLRHHLYRGDVLHTEEGFRYAWAVMIVERRGSVSYRLRDAQGRVREASPSEELTALQTAMMATQPDLILQYAHHLHRAHPEAIAIYADAFVSTNGQPQCRLVDPDVDLAAEEDSIFGFDWVLTEDDPRACPP